MKVIWTAILFVFTLSGCAPPSLVDRMKSLGVTHLNTSKIVLHGSEADVGSDVQVDVVEHSLIQAIWDSIYQSRPTQIWYASGYRRADFYSDTDLNHPACTLWINASDACHINKQPDRFRCPNLNSLVVKLLQKAYDNRTKGKPPTPGK